MTYEKKIQLARAVVQFTTSIAAATVVTSLLNGSKPIGLDKIDNFVYKVGVWSVSSLVAEATSEYVGRLFDGIMPNNGDNFFKDVVLPN